MSLITCCPACQTMFKVSGEDLRVSDGWVRCGNCDGVFDASAHLQVMPATQENSAAAPTAGEPDADLPNAVASPTPVLPAQTSASSQTAAFTVAERPSPFRAATSGDGTVFDASSVNIDVDAAAGAIGAATTMAATRFEPSPATLRREDRSAPPSFTDEPVTFLGDQASAHSRWRLVAWLLGLAVLVLAMLGGAALHERQALVQRVPALLPAMEALCGFSGCEVKAPRLLDMIAIEDASMQEVAPSEYKIQLLLKNQGHGAVEPPSLRVTLTGLHGEVLASHTVLPSQFAAGVTRIASNAPLSVAFNFSVASAGVAPVPASASDATPTSAPTEPAAALAEAMQAPAALPVSGYHVIAFYP
jgi:predicted Zn finger-like uncharacterized protein